MYHWDEVSGRMDDCWSLNWLGRKALSQGETYVC